MEKEIKSTNNAYNLVHLLINLPILITSKSLEISPTPKRTQNVVCRQSSRMLTNMSVLCPK